MSGYLTMLRMQVRYRLAALSPANIKEEMANKRFQTIAIIAAYCILAVSMLGTIVLLESQLLGAMIAMGTPDLLLGLAVLMGMMMTVVFGFFYIISSLYMGKDAAFIASLPVPSRAVFCAKLTEIWFGETGIMALTFVPACVLYGIRLSPDILFYARAVLVLLLSPVIPMMIVTILSTALIRVASLVRHREGLIMAGSLLVIFAAVYFQMSLTRLIPEDASEDFIISLLSDNRAMLETVTGAFPPAQWAARGLVGESGMLLLFLIITAGVVALIVLALGGIYQRLSLIQSEAYASGKKIKVNEKTFRIRSQFAALLKREWREIMRSPSYAINSLGGVAMPIIFAIIFSVNAQTGSMEGFGEMLTNLRGQFPDILLIGVIACIYCFCGGLNPAVATAISREGKRRMLLKMLPVKPQEHIMAKLFLGFTLSVISCVLCCGLISALLPSLLELAFAALAISLPVCFLICVLSLMIDIAKPRFNWNTETEAIKQNTNVLFGMLVSMVVIIVLALLTYALHTLALPDTLLLVADIVLPVIFCFVCWRLLMGKMSMVYGAIDG